MITPPTTWQSPSAAKWVIRTMITLIMGIFLRLDAQSTSEHSVFFSTVAGMKPRKTSKVGGSGGSRFAELRQEGGILVGLDFWAGNYAGHNVIKGIRPIFQTEAGRIRGNSNGTTNGQPTTLESKEGFAVSGLNVRSGDRVDGIQIQFSRLNPSRCSLDVADSYLSTWTGGKDGGASPALTGGGELIVGIYGGAGAEIDHLGLLTVSSETPSTKVAVNGGEGALPTKPKPTESSNAVPPVEKTPVASIKAIKLKNGWDTAMQGGSRTLKDMAFVLDGYGKANPNPEAGDIEVYNGVKYLMPLKDALVALKLNQRQPSAKEIACPGFPRGSFSYFSFDGLFEGHFNRLDLVCDSANQVVSVQLVDQDPKSTTGEGITKTGDWSTYNFVGYGVKAVTTMKIDYSLEELYKLPSAYGSNASPKWSYLGQFAQPGTPLMRRVNAILRDKTNKRKEQTQWYVPRPLADLLMYCVTKGQ